MIFRIIITIIGSFFIFSSCCPGDCSSRNELQIACNLGAIALMNRGEKGDQNAALIAGVLCNLSDKQLHDIDMIE